MFERFGQIQRDFGPVKAVLPDGSERLVAREAEITEATTGGYLVKVRRHKREGAARINVSNIDGSGVHIRDFTLNPGEERTVNGMGVVIKHLR